MTFRNISFCGEQRKRRCHVLINPSKYEESYFVIKPTSPPPQPPPSLPSLPWQKLRMLPLTIEWVVDILTEDCSSSNCCCGCYYYLKVLHKLKKASSMEWPRCARNKKCTFNWNVSPLSNNFRRCSEIAKGQSDRPPPEYATGEVEGEWRAITISSQKLIFYFLFIGRRRISLSSECPLMVQAPFTLHFAASSSPYFLCATTLTRLHHNFTLIEERP